MSIDKAPLEKGAARTGDQPAGAGASDVAHISVMIGKDQEVEAIKGEPEKSLIGTAEASHQGSGPTVASALQQLRQARSRTKPTAMVGFKEWIFSHKSGALGSFAAAAEYVFGTVLQRDMAWGHVRLHYGHPDVFDKIHCMTRVRRWAQQR